MWSGLGIALACIVIVVSLLKSKRGSGSYYAVEVYGMTARTHRAYAALSALFVLLFAASLLRSAVPAIPLLAAYVLIFIFYFSSFARGFSDEE